MARRGDAHSAGLGARGCAGAGARAGSKPAQRSEAKAPPLDAAEVRRRAAEEAADVIERARGRGRGRGNGAGNGKGDGGNVIRPPRFGGDRRKDLH
ncbi:MAG: hypothetical protein U1F49_16765 [Rubrivivax sp.]